MNHPIDPRLKLWLDLAGVLEELAAISAKELRKRYRERYRKRRGSTLRPGLETPLWNELARNVAIHFQRRGDKVRLARFLGVPRQRVHEYFVGRSAFPDVEHALRLLLWLKMESAPIHWCSPPLSRNT